MIDSLDIAPLEAPAPMSAQMARRLAQSLWGSDGAAIPFGGGYAVGKRHPTRARGPLIAFAQGPTYEAAFDAALSRAGR